MLDTAMIIREDVMSDSEWKMTRLKQRFSETWVSGFDLLIVQLSNMSLGAIMKSELKFTKKYSGRILIDTILHSGNNSSRFVSFDVESGIIITDSREKVLLDRRNEIRAKSNDLLK